MKSNVKYVFAKLQSHSSEFWTSFTNKLSAFPSSNVFDSHSSKLNSLTASSKSISEATQAEVNLRVDWRTRRKTRHHRTRIERSGLKHLFVFKFDQLRLEIKGLIKHYVNKQHLLFGLDWAAHCHLSKWQEILYQPQFFRMIWEFSHCSRHFEQLTLRFWQLGSLQLISRWGPTIYNLKKKFNSCAHN